MLPFSGGGPISHIDIEALRAKFFPFVTTAGFTVRPVPEAEMRACVTANFAAVFPSAADRGYFVLPDERMEQVLALMELRRSCHHEFFLFFAPDGKPVGWQMSEAEDAVTFYLRNTGILPEFQGKGVYREFSSRLEEYLSCVGFERLTSHHQATNRRILIRKLKDGFCVAGFELTERWGPLVKMVKLLQADRRGSFYRLFGSTEHLG